MQETVVCGDRVKQSGSDFRVSGQKGLFQEPAPGAVGERTLIQVFGKTMCDSFSAKKELREGQSMNRDPLRGPGGVWGDA